MGFFGQGYERQYTEPSEVSRVVDEVRELRAALRQIRAIVIEKGQHPPMTKKKLEDIRAILAVAGRYL